MFSLKMAVVLASLSVNVLAVVPIYGQCGGVAWTGETVCASGSACVKSSDFYSQCVPGAATSTSASSTTKASSTSTTKASSSTSTTKPVSSTTAAPTTPTGITKVLPASAGYTALPTASVISGSFDGKMVKFDRKGSSGDCQGQTETGEADAVFILESGASISNVIIGAAQAEGIHCRGPCTVTNVWWEDVCEDAITLKQTGANDVSIINGGGAFHASDKIVQHNGAGTVKISNFYASDFGKLYRGCGNCVTHYERHVEVNNVCLSSGKEGTGINTNWGDSASFTNVFVSGTTPSVNNVCCTYTGVAQGSEPSKIGCGSGYSACKYVTPIGTC